MWRYLTGRVLQTVLSMLVVVSIVFVLTRLSGNPVHLLLDVNATERDQEILTRHLGLDKPLPVQYGIYVTNIFLGDFGNSVLTRRPVTEHIWERLPATVELGFVAMFLSVLIGVPLGVYSAVRRGGVADSAARVFAVLGQSMPTFWLGLMLILFFGVVLGVLPAGGRGGLSHLILPAFTLGYFTSAAILRLTRSSMLEGLGADYIKCARLKGLHEQVVLAPPRVHHHARLSDRAGRRAGVERPVSRGEPLRRRALQLSQPKDSPCWRLAVGSPGSPA